MILIASLLACVVVMAVLWAWQRRSGRADWVDFAWSALIGLLALFGVLLITFVATRLSGDVTYLLVPLDATEEEIAKVRAEYGLDQPVLVQFWAFIKNVAVGDFGTSIKYDTPVLELVLSRLPATLLLSFTGFGVALVIGIVLGILAARFRGTAIDTYHALFFHSALVQAVGTGLITGKLTNDRVLSGLKFSIALVLVSLAVFAFV